MKTLKCFVSELSRFLLSLPMFMFSLHYSLASLPDLTLVGMKLFTTISFSVFMTQQATGKLEVATVYQEV